MTKRKSLSDLYGALPATRPYPGTKEIREEIGAIGPRSLRDGETVCTFDAKDFKRLPAKWMSPQLP